MMLVSRNENFSSKSVSFFALSDSKGLLSFEKVFPSLILGIREASDDVRLILDKGLTSLCSKLEETKVIGGSFVVEEVLKVFKVFKLFDVLESAGENNFSV